MSGDVSIIDQVPSLFHKYLDTFNRYSYNNDLYAKMSFHVVLGQVLKDVKIYKGETYLDSRMSFFLLQPSGSGKTTAFKFIKAIAEGVGLRVASLDEATDAALIGTTEEVTSYGEKEIQIVEGILGSCDIVHYDEASALIKKREHNKNTLTYFQKSLNPIGDPSNVIHKKLARGPDINMPSTCSYILTSFPPPGILQAIIETGFFQRLLIATRRLTRDERRKNSMLDVDMLGKRWDNNELDEYEIIKEIEEVRKYGREIDYQVVFTERIKPVIRNKINQYYKAIEAPNQTISNLLDTFVPRYQDHLYRVSAHSAVMNYRNTVQSADVGYAFDLTFPIFKMLLAWMEQDTEMSTIPQKEKDNFKIMARVYQKLPKLKDDKWVGSTQFVEEVQKYLKVSKPTVYAYIKTFMNQQQIQSLKEGKRIWYCIPHVHEQVQRVRRNGQQNEEMLQNIA